MMPRSPRGVLCLCGLMAVLSVAAVGSTLNGTSDHLAAAKAFQELTGGLGGGPTVDLACPAHLDPRLDGECRFDAGPVPGGSLLCPRCGRELLPATADVTRPIRRTSDDVGVH